MITCVLCLAREVVSQPALRNGFAERGLRSFQPRPCASLALDACFLERCFKNHALIFSQLGPGQTVKCFRIDMVVHLRSVDADEDYLSTPLYRDFGAVR
jgi:hypothetical protein